MAELILVTGGARSGKSDYAQSRAEALDGRRCFIATCAADDAEMRRRVEKHRRGRDASRWDTVEEPLALDVALDSCHSYRVCLIDCLTLWVSNVMARRHELGLACEEEHVIERLESWLAALGRLEGACFVVTNEVGLGIVPEHEVARRYRDLVGTCNRIVAGRADEVVLISCGLPLHLKQKALSR